MGSKDKTESGNLFKNRTGTKNKGQGFKMVIFHY